MILFLMTFLAISPAVAAATYAEEVDEEEQLVLEQSDEVAASTDTPSTTALTNSSYQTSSITIGFVPTKAETSLSPIDAAGAKGKINVKVNINLQNSDGYKIYVGSDSDQLKNGDDTIDPLTSEVDYNNIPVNHWGFSIQEGETAKDSYKAMPTNLRGTPEITSKEDEKNIKNKDLTYTLSFAANIDATKPAGTYSNEVTVSVVSSPREVNAFGIETMQEMTNEICNKAPNGAEAQLKDTRDGKFYWIGKLKSDTAGNYRCWMTQNLDLDLTANDSTTITAENSQTAYTPSYTTAATVKNNQLADNTGQRSWSLGDYYLADPTNSNDCSTGANDIKACKDKNGMSAKYVALATPTSPDGDTNAHYLIGNHYQWNAATAGTGKSMTSGQATGSICAKGWRLPESNVTTVGSFGGLVNGNSITTVGVLTGSPYYFVRGGVVYQDGTNLYGYAGGSGGYWSSTPVSNGTQAYNLSFGSASTGPDVNPSYSNDSRHNGFSVRCINNPNI